LTKLPWIPSEQQWLAILEVARLETVRNRVMLALAYDAALRREELCSLCTDDLDPAHRTLRIRAETTKNRLERIAPYLATTGVLLSDYLAYRATLSRAQGLLFLSQSRRNLAQPLTLWTWSKVVRRIALAAGVPRFATHTTRHLCLTDLARMGGSCTQSPPSPAIARRVDHAPEKIAPTVLAKAYRDAGYFARNVRTIEVLVDRDAVTSGAAASGEPWQYYDLGHGYCTYTFFEQCPHRMACAHCDFYAPKTSSRAQLLEAKENLQRMATSIPLTEEERAAVDDGQAALDQLLNRLVDMPTPAEPTPREIGAPPSTTLLPIIDLGARCQQ